MASRGILLSNLGSPDSPTTADVRAYLNEFLMDERVLDTPYLLRRFIVSAFILPKRPKESAEAYRSIWTDAGSPLVVTTLELRDLVQERLDEPVEVAMRYGSPSMTEGLSRLIDRAGPELREMADEFASITHLSGRRTPTLDRLLAHASLAGDSGAAAGFRWHPEPS